jgi:hypothetical protein
MAAQPLLLKSQNQVPVHDWFVKVYFRHGKSLDVQTRINEVITKYSAESIPVQMGHRGVGSEHS